MRVELYGCPFYGKRPSSSNERSSDLLGGVVSYTASPSTDKDKTYDGECNASLAFLTDRRGLRRDWQTGRRSDWGRRSELVGMESLSGLDRIQLRSHSPLQIDSDLHDEQELPRDSDQIRPERADHTSTDTDGHVRDERLQRDNRIQPGWIDLHRQTSGTAFSIRR